MNLNPKIIKYYRKSIYGTIHEMIHPDCAADAFDIKQLTNQKTINPLIRNSITRLSNDTIQFQEVIAPVEPVQEQRNKIWRAYH